MRFAREHDLLVSVRGGGHSAGGRAVCQGGLMIDLSPMTDVRVDPTRRTAIAQPGVKLGESDQAAQAFGLATTSGVASDTGIAGLTLGGGYGWLDGKYGLACGNLVSVEIVTADGRLVTASGVENPDLFWGVRGAGANFGVVMSFEFRLHSVGPVLAGLVLYPIDRGKETLRLFHEFSAACPDEVSTVGLLLSAPDGTPAVGIAACYTGPLDEGERILKPVRTLGSPIADLFAARSYTETPSLFDQNWLPGQFNYWENQPDAGAERDDDQGVARTRRGAARPRIASFICSSCTAPPAAFRPAIRHSRIASTTTTADHGRSGRTPPTPRGASAGPVNPGTR